jgi:hypothetical protein
MSSYYAVHWQPLITALPYIGVAVLLLIVIEIGERYACRWANRARIYDWAADPKAVTDFYTDEALDALARAVVEWPERVLSLVPSQKKEAPRFQRGA